MYRSNLTAEQLANALFLEIPDLSAEQREVIKLILINNETQVQSSLVTNETSKMVIVDDIEYSSTQISSDKSEDLRPFNMVCGNPVTTHNQYANATTLPKSEWQELPNEIVVPEKVANLINNMDTTLFNRLQFSGLARMLAAKVQGWITEVENDPTQHMPAFKRLVSEFKTSVQEWLAIESVANAFIAWANNEINQPVESLAKFLASKVYHWHEAQRAVPGSPLPRYQEIKKEFFEDIQNWLSVPDTKAHAFGNHSTVLGTGQEVEVRNVWDTDFSGIERGINRNLQYDPASVEQPSVSREILSIDPASCVVLTDMNAEELLNMFDLIAEQLKPSELAAVNIWHDLFENNTTLSAPKLFIALIDTFKAGKKHGIAYANAVEHANSNKKKKNKNKR